MEEGSRSVEGNSGVTLCCGPSQENPESQPQKRLRPSAKPSVLAEVKGSVSASHQGTLNPTAQNPCQLSAPGISLKEAANVVVKCLTPFYKEGKFASKVGGVGGLCLLPGLGYVGVVGARGRECEPQNTVGQSRLGRGQSRIRPPWGLPCHRVVAVGCSGGQGRVLLSASLLPLLSRSCLKALPATSHTC